MAPQRDYNVYVASGFAGTYTLKQLQSRVAEGHIPRSATCGTVKKVGTIAVGQSPPVPISSIPELADIIASLPKSEESASVAPTVDSSNPRSVNRYSDEIEDIIGIAEAQRDLMRAVCGIVIVWVLSILLAALHLGPVVLLGFPVMMFLAGFNTYRLDVALKSSKGSAVLGAFLAALLSFGCIGLLVMAMVSSRAGKALKARGLNSGFMGVSQQSLDSWIAAARERGNSTIR